MLSDPGGPGLAGLGSESAIDVNLKAARRFKQVCRAATPRACKSIASEKTSNKYLRYYSAMDSEAHEDDFLLSRRSPARLGRRKFSLRTKNYFGSEG